MDNQRIVIAIVVAIISVLFFVQKAGTSKIGKGFGPIMTLWFLFLAVAGLPHIFENFNVLRALNPVRGIMFLFNGNLNAAGLMVLGNVFLCTTGAEALYSDMGHVGKPNIYATWPFVKVCLILNYLGQGAWILANKGNVGLAAMADLNPFFQMLPEQVRVFAVLLSTLAAIIASQALITGSFSIVSEAVRLDLMPHMRINYPSETKGQIYIPMVNNVMWVACICVVLFFQTSAHMEAAYGLAITVTMLMTTVLLHVPLAHPSPDGAGHPVRDLLWRHRVHVLLLEPHEVLPRRLRHRGHRVRDLRRSCTCGAAAPPSSARRRCTCPW